MLYHCFGINDSFIDSKRRPCILIVHFGEVLIHLLVIFVVVKRLELHLKLALLRSESVQLLQCGLQLLLQVIPLEYYVLQVQLRFHGADCQTIVRQVHYVCWQRIAGRLLRLNLLANGLLFTLLLDQ